MGSLYIDAQGCVPVLLENLYGMSCVVCLALELVGPWVVLGFRSEERRVGKEC